ncbi:hypothetical protein [Pannonibacter phragmitetus]|uniref:hypothetical protein n=1 Tax=Pannonibacter phragmitetus TaxID=121719 RepID=UPI000A9A6FF1|nr:hypothetical protein [Pannonibacter phragmitetus]
MFHRRLAAARKPFRVTRPSPDVAVRNAVQRLIALAIYLLLIAVLLLVAPPARADGGAHVVDSANPETPGVCHLESWVTHYGQGRGLLNSSPACTPLALPNVEIGGAIQHLWDRADETTIGPAVKVNLRPTDTGLGIGLIVGGAVGLRSGRVETGSLVVPFSIPIGDRILVNLNAGWTYAYAREHRQQAFFGAQINAQVRPDLTAMVEIFGHERERLGRQVGLRWNPGGGRYDVDLLAGHRVDGTSAQAITLGLTVRY